MLGALPVWGVLACLRDLIARHRARLASLAVLVAVMTVAWWQWDIAASGRTLVTVTRGSHFSDFDLYTEIAARVTGGEGYYAAATASHRVHGYPTIPWFTLRLPTLAWVTAWLGPAMLLLVAKGLVLAGVAAWAWAFLQAGAKWFEALGAAVIALASGLIVFYMSSLLHEFWAGMLMSLAFALYRPGRALPAIVLAVIACFFREFAILLVGIGLVLALGEGRRRESWQWFGASVVVAAFYTCHALWVIDARLPGDTASPGWHGLIGMAEAVSWVVQNSMLRMFGLVAGGTVLLLSLFGWLAAGRRAWLVLPVALAWFAAIAIFARPANYYWSQLFLPWLPVGLALLPRLLAMALGRNGLDAGK